MMKVLLYFTFALEIKFKNLNQISCGCKRKSSPVSQMSTKLWTNTCLDFPVKRVKCIMSPCLFLRRSTRTKTTAWQVKFAGENNASISQFWLQERLLSTAVRARLENILLLFWSQNVMMQHDPLSSSLHIWLLKVHVISKLLVDGGCQGSYAKHMGKVSQQWTRTLFLLKLRWFHTLFKQSISHCCLTNYM